MVIDSEGVMALSSGIDVYLDLEWMVFWWSEVSCVGKEGGAGDMRAILIMDFILTLQNLVKLALVLRYQLLLSVMVAGIQARSGVAIGLSRESDDEAGQTPWNQSWLTSRNSCNWTMI